MSRREFRLLLVTASLRFGGLVISIGGVLGLVYFAPAILTAAAGDTAKALLVAAVAVFTIAVKDMAEGLKTQYTEFITTLRSASGQEKEE